MLKQILLFLLLAQTFLFAQNAHTGLSEKQIYSYLSTIDSKAILLGKGEKDIYVFIDPLCKFSKKFMTKVTENEFMLKKYRYHIFLYELPRLHSQDTINYIYNSPQQLQTLLDIMLKDIKPKYVSDPMKTNTKIVSDISKTAKKIHVNKRPFIIVSQKVF